MLNLEISGGESSSLGGAARRRSGSKQGGCKWRRPRVGECGGGGAVVYGRAAREVWRAAWERWCKGCLENGRGDLISRWEVAAAPAAAAEQQEGEWVTGAAQGEEGIDGGAGRGWTGGAERGSEGAGSRSGS